MDVVLGVIPKVELEREEEEDPVDEQPEEDEYRDDSRDEPVAEPENDEEERFEIPIELGMRITRLKLRPFRSRQMSMCLMRIWMRILSRVN